MKTIFRQVFFILLFSGTGFSFAQKIEWSNIRNEDLKYDYVKVLGTDENGFYVLKSNLPFEYKRDHYGFRSRKFSIAYFDNDMNLKMQKPLTSPQKDSHLFTVVFVDERVLLINDVLDKEKQQYHFYAQWLNSKGISEKSAVKIGDFQYDSKSDLENVTIIVSKDQRVFCIVTPDIETSKEKQSITAAAIDTSLTVIWKKQLEIPYSKRTYSTQNSLLSDEGNFYLSGTLKADSDKSKYLIFSYDYKQNRQSEIPVSIGEKLADVSFTFDNANNTLVAAGLYSDKESSAITGVFYANIDVNKSVITDIKTQKLTDRPGAASSIFNQSNNEDSYSINRLILRNDGGIVLFAEVTYITQSSYYDYFTRSFINKWIYHYNNILTVSINPDGSIDWQVPISKNQESQEDGGYYSSYCSLIYGSKMNVIYNNSIDKNNTVLIQTINNKGAKDQKILINEAERVLLIPKGALQVDDNILIIPGIRGREFCYAKITF